MNLWILALIVAMFYAAVYFYAKKNRIGQEWDEAENERVEADRERERELREVIADSWYETHLQTRMVDYNESILKGRGGVPLSEDVSSLYDHPTIVCRWSGHRNHGGPKPAVWMKDMTYPTCKGCLHEDPYE